MMVGDGHQTESLEQLHEIWTCHTSVLNIYNLQSLYIYTRQAVELDATKYELFIKHTHTHTHHYCGHFPAVHFTQSSSTLDPISTVFTTLITKQTFQSHQLSS